MIGCIFPTDRCLRPYELHLHRYCGSGSRIQPTTTLKRAGDRKETGRGNSFCAVCIRRLTLSVEPMNVSPQRAKGGLISASICAPGLDLIEPWNDLAARLESNAFMHPAALLAATETGLAKIHVLLAWDDETTPRRPVGFWALRERNDLPLTPTFLEALPYDYAFTSNAMVDATCVDDVVAAFFDAIRRDVRLPKIVSLPSFEADPIVYPAMLQHLASTGRYHEFFRVERPFADRSAGTKKSTSTRKKLRQLSAVGAVEIVNERAPAGAGQRSRLF